MKPQIKYETRHFECLVSSLRQYLGEKEMSATHKLLKGTYPITILPSGLWLPWMMTRISEKKINIAFRLGVILKYQSFISGNYLTHPVFCLRFVQMFRMFKFLCKMLRTISSLTFNLADNVRIQLDVISVSKRSIFMSVRVLWELLYEDRLRLIHVPSWTALT